CPALADAAAFRRFFEHEGYAIVPAALPAALCAETVDAFLREVHLATQALFLRQPPTRYAAHVYTLAGHMQYPIVNLQDLCAPRYPHFRSAALALLTDATLQRAVATLLGEPARLGESRFFDADPATAPHRDVPFAAGAAPMVGAWIAAEDVGAATAGRFFVLPRSHWRTVPGEPGAPRASSRYKAAMADLLAQDGVARVAPALRQGDLLLWNALTIHGSLPATNAASARRALTAHYTAASAPLPRGAVRALVAGGMPIVQHADPRSLAGLLRSACPHAYAQLRQLAQWRPWRGHRRQP
ncbi:MAG: phytanoyl-CoA dioxygenase family protein, partial [Pseudomonadota bacterium]|nr:phytanoyl-CoA dioxygenase family protein [Pseudomonadota bacterium]